MAYAFNLWDLVYNYFAELIDKGDDQKASIVAWLVQSRRTRRTFRNNLVTILLRRYGDVENALALLASLGFSREQIEHNRSLIERVERVNQTLAQTGALPQGENLENLELFGYVRSPEWIHAPGYFDFFVSLSGGGEPWVGSVVRFRLVVETHPRDGRPVLNAIALRPETR